MATIPSQTRFPTSNQVPQNSILDAFNRQTYLGNQFILPIVNQDLSSTSETNMLLVTNPSTTKSLFVGLRRYSSSAQQILVKLYTNATIAAAGIESITTVADSSGSLNDTYFTFVDTSGAGFYVWYNINSAGTDPAIPTLTGIEVTAATNASANTIATDTKNAINTATPVGIVASVSTDVVKLTYSTQKFSQPADGPAGSDTHFTFAVFAGLGDASFPVNQRPANSNTSVSACYTSGNFAVSTNGTFTSGLGVPADYYVTIDNAVMIIVDPGQNILITATALTEDTLVNLETSWYEL